MFKVEVTTQYTRNHSHFPSSIILIVSVFLPISNFFFKQWKSRWQARPHVGTHLEFFNKLCAVLILMMSIYWWPFLSGQHNNEKYLIMKTTVKSYGEWWDKIVWTDILAYFSKEFLQPGEISKKKNPSAMSFYSNNIFITYYLPFSCSRVWECRLLLITSTTVSWLPPNNVLIATTKPAVQLLASPLPESCLS